MLGFLKEIFGEENTNIEMGHNFVNNAKDDIKVQMATCALFLEIANSDDEFSKEEKEQILIIMEKTFNLTKEQVKELIELSEEQMRKSVSLYEFTNIINKKFSREQKYKVLKNLWRLIFVDNKLHAYEDYFIRKISANFHLSHKDLIAAKLEAKAETE